MNRTIPLVVAALNGPFRRTRGWKARRLTEAEDFIISSINSMTPVSRAALVLRLARCSKQRKDNHNED